jgi:hypothetical protein
MLIKRTVVLATKSRSDKCSEMMAVNDKECAAMAEERESDLKLVRERTNELVGVGLIGV